MRKSACAISVFIVILYGKRRETAVAPFCMGSGMNVYKLEDRAYAVHLVTWSGINGYISEWDFTIARNGAIHIHEIRDIDWKRSRYFEVDHDFPCFWFLRE